eukprot:3263163-Pyramimonas_sp.AAC.1
MREAELLCQLPAAGSLPSKFPMREVMARRRAARSILSMRRTSLCRTPQQPSKVTCWPIAASPGMA